MILGLNVPLSCNYSTGDLVKQQADGIAMASGSSPEIIRKLLRTWQQEFRYAAGIGGNIVLLVVNDNPPWCQIKIFRMKGIAKEFRVIVKIGAGVGFQPFRNLKLNPILDILDIGGIVLIKVAEC